MANDVRLIDANALKKSLQESYDELMRKRNNTPYGEERKIADAQLITFSECILRLKGQPTINPESLRPVGEWVGEGDGYADGELVFDVWNCDNCGYCIDDGTDDPAMLPNYCPNCGARMKGANDG